MSAALRNHLASLSTRSHDFVLHLSRLLSTSSGIEASLCTIIFTFTLVHSQLQRLLEKQYEKLALSFASKASQTLLPGEAVVAAIEPPTTRLSQTCLGVKNLVDITAEFWMFMRLWGLVHIYKWAVDVYRTQHRDPIVKTLLWAQIGAAATFQAMENVAYLAMKGVIRGPKWEERAPKWMAWSNRFWMVQVLLEGMRLLRVRSLKWDEDLGAERAEDEKSSSSESVATQTAVTAQSAALRKRWQSDFAANAGWLPLTLHWSYVDESNSPVPETWRGLSGLVPSIALMSEAWKESA